MASVCGRHWPTDWPRGAPSSLELDWDESSSVVSRLGPRGGVLDDVMAAMAAFCQPSVRFPGAALCHFASLGWFFGGQHRGGDRRDFEVVWNHRIL